MSELGPYDMIVLEPKKFDVARMGGTFMYQFQYSLRIDVPCNILPDHEEWCPVAGAQVIIDRVKEKE